MLTNNTFTIPKLFIQNYIRSTGFDEILAQQHFVEVVKFLTICSESQEVYAPSANLDIAWHNFILCTEDYKDFCKKNLQRFIHHRPSLVPEIEAYARARVAAEKRFGQLDPYMWPADVRLAGDCDDCKACTDGEKGD